eukprot:scaffold8030_cov417-Prasinococcus_capsulatus_cf.AAC.1
MMGAPGCLSSVATAGAAARAMVGRKRGHCCVESVYRRAAHAATRNEAAGSEAEHASCRPSATSPIRGGPPRTAHTADDPGHALSGEWQARLRALGATYTCFALPRGRRAAP